MKFKTIVLLVAFLLAGCATSGNRLDYFYNKHGIRENSVKRAILDSRNGYLKMLALEDAMPDFPSDSDAIFYGSMNYWHANDRARREARLKAESLLKVPESTLSAHEKEMLLASLFQDLSKHYGVANGLMSYFRFPGYDAKGMDGRQADIDFIKSNNLRPSKDCKYAFNL